MSYSNLLDSIRSFSFDTITDQSIETPLHQAIESLSTRSNKELETAVKEKFEQAVEREQRQALEVLTRYALEHGKTKMIDVCQRIVSAVQLEKCCGVVSSTALAKREAMVVPRPPKVSDVAKSLFFRLRHSPTFDLILEKIISNPILLVTGTLQGYLTIIARFPPEHVMEIKDCLHLFKMMFKDMAWVLKSYLSFFSSKTKAATAGAGIVGVFLILNYLRRYLQFTARNQRNGFRAIENKERNLTTEARHGQIQRIEGRRKEKEIIYSCLHGSRIRIPFLVAETGSGKSALVEGLAWDTAFDTTSPFYGKTIISVSMATFYQAQDIDAFLKKFEGHEDEIILFLDEAQIAGMSAGSAYTLLEYFKTTLLEKKLRIIFATTKEEFDKYIATNRPFKRRVKQVPLDTFPDSDTKAVLRRHIKKENRQADEGVFDAIVSITHRPGFQDQENPSKAIDILGELINFCDDWVPVKIGDELAKQEQLENDLDDEIQLANAKPEWSSSAKGIAAFQQLDEVRAHIISLQDKQQKQRGDLTKIKDLKDLLASYKTNLYRATHVLADQKGPTDEKVARTFLFFKFIVIPTMLATLNDTARHFEETYGERIPLKIDLAAVRKLYPAPTEPSDPATSSSTLTSAAASASH